MKRGSLIISLFLISILFISSCVQQSPATVDPSSCNGEEFTWSMRTSSIFYDSEGDRHVVTLFNVERDYAKFKIDDDSSGIGGYFGDPVYYDFNNNGANDTMLSALSYHPGRIWSRIGSVDVCLTFIEDDVWGEACSDDISFQGVGSDSLTRTSNNCYNLYECHGESSEACNPENGGDEYCSGYFEGACPAGYQSWCMEGGEEGSSAEASEYEFRYTTSTNVWLNLDTCGPNTNFDTKLIVYDYAGIEVCYNDDAFDKDNSAEDDYSTCGQNYGSEGTAQCEIWCGYGPYSSMPDGHPQSSMIPDNYHNNGCYLSPGSYSIIISEYINENSCTGGYGGTFDFNIEVVAV
jgi:hypothetical protein